MRVAAVQFKAEKGRREASLSALLRLAEDAATNADLVVLPEMALTGYAFADRGAVRDLAEPAHGPTFRAFALVAKLHRAWVVVGYPERDGEHLYNSALVIDDEGALRFSYRKTMLFEGDWSWATPGNSGYRAFDTAAGRFGVGICMDINDNGFVRWVRDEKLDAIAFPTNWVDEGEPVWPYWRTRLGGIRSGLVAANSYGVDGPYQFSGKSAVLRGGLVVAQAAPLGDEVITATL